MLVGPGKSGGSRLLASDSRFWSGFSTSGVQPSTMNSTDPGITFEMGFCVRGQVVYSRVLDDHTGDSRNKRLEIEGYPPAFLSNLKGLSTSFST